MAAAAAQASAWTLLPACSSWSHVSSSPTARSNQPTCTPAAAAAAPQIRESIKSLFPNRDCFTLVRPVNDEETLARLDTLSPDQMRPEFK